jgi:hypothetical protein
LVLLLWYLDLDLFGIWICLHRYHLVFPLSATIVFGIWIWW